MSRILLIEPDRILAQTYVQALQAAGHPVVPCASAQAAILAADEITPEAVILELQLIEHSGIEFLYEFRSYAEWQRIPVIIQSYVPPGEFTASPNILYRQLGIHAYLYKPLTTLARLLESVADAVPVA